MIEEGCPRLALLAPALLLALALLPAPAQAGDPAAPRSKLPEPLLGESITDLDGTEAGEVELDATGLWSPAQAGAAQGLRGSIEVEWRVTERLGLAAELGLGAGTAGRGPEPSLIAGLSFVLLHDRAHDAHLMAELRGRLLDEEEGAAELPDPGEPALRTAAGLRGGLRAGFLTARGAISVEAIGRSAHALPLRAELALLCGLGPGGRFGFAGAEAIADWARRDPLVIAPQLVLDFAALGLRQLKLGLSLPWPPAIRAGAQAQVGLLARLLVELDAD